MLMGDLLVALNFAHDFSQAAKPPRGGGLKRWLLPFPGSCADFSERKLGSYSIQETLHPKEHYVISQSRDFWPAGTRGGLPV